MLTCLVLDVNWHTPKQNPTLPSAFFGQHFWTNEATPHFGSERVMITPGAEEFLTYVSSTNAQRVWDLKRRAEWSNLNLLDDIPKVNGSATLQTREQRLVEQSLYSMTNRLPAGLLDFLGVAWVTSSNGMIWNHRSSALPLVTAGQRPLFLDETNSLIGMTNNGFEARDVVFLPPSAREYLQDANNTAAQVSNVLVTSHSVSATVNSLEPTIAVIAQSFYSTWHATVDDANAPILRANVAFQAVPVPAGRHRVHLFYADKRFTLGLEISAASLLICIVTFLYLTRRASPHQV
jgi:hypothetical protein